MDSNAEVLGPTLTFRYGGATRVVQDAVRKTTEDGHEVIVGRMTEKDGEATDEPRAFRVDRIEGDIEDVTP